MSEFFDELTRAIAKPMPRQRALRIAMGAVAAGLFAGLSPTAHAADCGTRGMCSDGKCCSAGSTHCCAGDLHCCFNEGPLSQCCGLAVCCGPDQVCCPSAHGNGIANGGGCCPAGSTCCGDSCCQSSQTCVNGACLAANCDVLQSKVDVAAAQLQADNANVSGLLNQIQNQAATAAGLAPELTPLAQSIADAIGQIDMTHQAKPDDGAAFATAAEAWALGQGAQQINALMAQSTSASGGLAAAIAANVQELLTVVQGLTQNAMADAQVLADAQAALDACNTAG